MNLYIELNLWIVFTLVIFKLIPWRNKSFRSVRLVAQVMLLISILAPLGLATLPDEIFPTIKSPVVHALITKDVDGNTPLLTPTPSVETNMPFKTFAMPQSKTPSIWLLLFFPGLLFVAARWALQAYRLSKVLRSTIVLHQVGRVRVSITEAISVPFSVLTVRWAHVVLPIELVQSPSHLKIALRHEIEHHRRRDTLWAQFIELLICLFYLNPAIYAWKKTILELQELACDEALIGRMGISPHAYGSCLLKVAEIALANRFMCAGTTCMDSGDENNSRSFLSRRIKMLAHHQRPQRHYAAIAIGTVVSMFIVVGAYAAQAALRTDNSINPGRPVFDPTVQTIATETLRNSLKNLKASAGFVLVSEVETGKLLATASLNDGFDPKLKGDWALSYPMAPASGLKSVITAAALDNGATTLTEMHNGEKKKKLSTTDVVVQSSNFGMIDIATKLGPAGLEDALKEFGFGENGSTKDFPGAHAGFVPSSNSAPADHYINSVALGSTKKVQFYVSPLEMVEAYGAIANGGRLMKPMNANENNPTVLRQVVSPETADQMRQILRKVVTEGTGQSIRESKIKLAGKTSTFEMPGNKMVGGFIGYAPADNPKIVVYVAIFDPKVKENYGSRTAAPVFKEVAEKVLALNKL